MACPESPRASLTPWGDSRDPTFPTMPIFPSDASSFGVRQLTTGTEFSSPGREGAVCCPFVVSWVSGLVSPARRLLAACSCPSVTFHLDEWEGWGLDPWHNFWTH